MIMQWEKEEVKPKILIHTCCAPCSTHTLEFMSQYAEITLFFQIRIFILKVSICEDYMNKTICRPI